MKYTVYILLGSNLGDRLANLVAAQWHIEKNIAPISKASRVYETKPWGKTDQPDFLNQVIVIETDTTPAKLLKMLLAIENEIGRKRSIKWGERIIDLDILFFGDLTINTERLTIPHPAIPARRFTLVPLQELAPELIHPLLHKSISALLEACNDPLAVIEVN